jgi:RNA polymerase sigma-70 factor (ECF subfamily)
MARDLVQRAVSGDLEAFSELVRQRIDQLYGIARLILRDSEGAQDATQEALVAAWRDLSGLRDPDRFDPWLRRLLVNACNQQARRDRRRRHYEGSVTVVEHLAPDPATALADRDQIERGFRDLDPQQRALVVMHFYLDLPLAETAESLGLPVGTVKSRLHRTTRLLRATLDAQSRNGHHPGGRA